MSRPWKIGLAVAGAVCLVAGVALAVAARQVSSHAREWVVEYLTEHFRSEVQLTNFQLSALFPLVQASGEGLVLRFEGREDLPPLLAIERFTVRASLLGLMRNPRRLQLVHLEGMELNIPPRGEGPPGNNRFKGALGKMRSVSFGLIATMNTTLRILPKQAGKDPLQFDISSLELRSTPDNALAFNATLTNPKPPGNILSSGAVGPWQAGEPGLTPVSGDYTFAKADLGHFRGISGILSSEGKYTGVLERIEADGTTDTPDFQVTRAGHPVHLQTSFHAIIDGTNGDTYLQPVIARFGETTLVTRGGVAGTPGRKGKTITLEVDGSDARIQDLLLFALRQQPTLTGPIRLQTKFELPPGPEDISDKLKLDGSFAIDAARFTSGTVQQRVDNLNQRSRGAPEEVTAKGETSAEDDVVSAMRGGFRLAGGVITLSGLRFQVPAAQISLNGTYQINDEALDLRGTLTTDAKISEMTTGVKSFLLKAVDPFFSNGKDGASIPIKITGTAKEPSYGLDLRRGRK